MTCESKPVGRATGAMDIELLDNRCYGCQVAELYNYHRPHGALDGQTPYERLLARKASARVLPKS